jgi:ABC-type nickel/cobalt efflux system permease component RcnA
MEPATNLVYVETYRQASDTHTHTQTHTHTYTHTHAHTQKHTRARTRTRTLLGVLDKAIFSVYLKSS